MIFVAKLIDSRVFLRDNESPPRKSKPEETQRRKVYGSTVSALFETMTARLPIIAKPHKSGDAKPDVRTPNLCNLFGQDRPANRKANTGKPVGAKLWV